MENNQKNQPPHVSGRGTEDPDRKNNQVPKTRGTVPQKPSATEEDNARMRFENEYEQTDNQNRKEEFKRKAENQSPNSSQNNRSSNEGLNEGSKQSNSPITNKKSNQDTESLNK